MRLSQLLGKRIINIFDGEILGLVGDADLVVNPDTGLIEALIIPSRGERLAGEKKRFGAEPHLLQIPWEKVCKVGSEVIVVDVDPQAL
ncbi:MAG: YlmC/YmxH family sporulation protein [Firmicutes bacterium]|nr:YlmC/YmxH family sporulation protein [Bacillota bacterium]